MLKLQVLHSAFPKKFFYSVQILLFSILFFSSKVITVSSKYQQEFYIFTFALCSVVFFIVTDSVQKESLFLFFILSGLACCSALACSAEPYFRRSFLTCISYIFIFACGMLSAEIFSHKTFVGIYINFLSIVAALSIPHFLILILNPALAWQLARPFEVEGFRYLVTPLYTWGWKDALFTRNAGPFWEPGAFSGFLIVALLFLLLHPKTIRHPRFKFFLLLFVELTTQSTTGYIILAVIFLFFQKDLLRLFWGKVTHKNVMILRLCFGCILLVGLVFIFRSNVVTQKLTATNMSTQIRLNDLVSSMKMIYEKPVFGYGFGTTRLTRQDYYNIEYNSNGILFMATNFGLPFTLVYLYFLFKNSIRWFDVHSELQKYALWLILLILHSTEGLFALPLYIVFIFHLRRNTI